MNNRENFMAVMNYQVYDRLPVIHFGYWRELLEKWAEEGHITREQSLSWRDGNEVCSELNHRLGFDYDFQNFLEPIHYLNPPFEERVMATFPDGSSHVMNSVGVVELNVPGALSIHSEIDHLLHDRASWEKEYKPKLQWSMERLGKNLTREVEKWNQVTQFPAKLHLGSVIGVVRDYLGVVGMSYMQLDDPELLEEIIDTLADVSYKNTEAILKAGYRPDCAHYWEDICFNHGPLISPDFFAKYVVKHYKKMSALLKSYHCELLSIDCDGLIDELLPGWVDGGVNLLFPIEIGTWNPDFRKWRETYGRNLRGIGAMNKHVLSQDRAAVDREIERLKPVVALGGFIPCPDHRLPPETKWDTVCYYTEKMRSVKWN